MNTRLFAGALLIAALLSGCSLRTLAVNKLGDSLVSGGTTFASDDDPELVAQALPFSLKLMESILAETPNHRGLLLATSSGFTQYAYAFVQQEAEQLESDDYEQSAETSRRAARLYLRARDYGLRGLEVTHPRFGKTVRENPKAAVLSLRREDVPLAYWTAASWGAAISLSKTNPDLVAEQPVVEALIDRALELDDAFDSGAIHSFLITYEPARQGATDSAAERSRQHFERAVTLTGGKMAAPYIALAESVCVSSQDRAAFEKLLNTALEIDPDARKEWRLANLIAQRRARWLLDRADDLFLDSATGSGTSELIRVPQAW